MKRKTILVTGAAGYIGSAVVDVLCNKGYNVIGVDNYSTGSIDRVAQLRENHKFFEMRNIDLSMDNQCDTKLMQVFISNQIDAVLHLASLTSVPEGEVHPLEYYDNNLKSTLNLLKVMNRFSVKNIIFTSTAAVYESESYPVSEDGALNPISVYGESKLMIENILQSCKNSGTLDKLVIFRFFNVAGSHNGLIPNSLSASLIPTLVRKIKYGDSFIQYGDKLDTEDGSCYRDFIHVSDIASAFIKVLETESEGVFNIGTGLAVSVNDVVKVAEKVTNKEVSKIVKSPRESEILFSCANSDKLKKLGWIPTKGVEDMVKELWDSVPESRF